MGIIKSLFKTTIRIVIMLFQTLLFFVFMGICLYIYARYIEPQLLEVKEVQISSNYFAQDMEPLKVIQLSDTHLGEYYSLEAFKKLIDKVNSYHPDIIVFTGDLLDNPKAYQEASAAAKELGRLEAKYGKWAVYGNHDHGANGTKLYREMMKAGGFKLLVNQDEVIQLKNNQTIRIMGIDDLILGAPSIKATLQNIQTKEYNLLLAHEPDLVDKVKPYSVDLMLSGHSHGGQVSIPFIGAPLTPPYAKNYIKGLYTFEDSKRLILYVNRGIGTSQLPYRFLNIPEMTVFTITHE